MIEHEFHEAANEFPMLGEERLRELAEDIKANGQREPIRLYREKILDGRNRFKACQIASVDPKYELLPDDIDPWSYVWSLNGERRDLSADHRYLIWKSCHEKSEAWQEAQARIARETSRKRAEATKAQPRASDGTMQPKPQVPQPVELADKPPARRKVTNETKAEASKTNRGAVERMDRLVSKRPDLAEKVRHGELKPTAALRIMKKESVAEEVAAFPDGKYRVIYADPPWSYGDTREGLNAGDGFGPAVDRSSTAARDHYPTMSMADLRALDVPALAADDCVLFCWATFPLLPDQLEVVKAWGFKYKTAFVWDKGRGTFGHYHTAESELLLVATKGSCTPDADKREKQVQRFERGAHSAKPEGWRELIDRLYPHGARIELFRRGVAPDGWHVWGNEAQDTAA
jgi:N6-adenosine-specific RNA methylase IME4